MLGVVWDKQQLICCLNYTGFANVSKRTFHGSVAFGMGCPWLLCSELDVVKLDSEDSINVSQLELSDIFNFWLFLTY